MKVLENSVVILEIRLCMVLEYSACMVLEISAPTLEIKLAWCL